MYLYLQFYARVWVINLHSSQNPIFVFADNSHIGCFEDGDRYVLFELKATIEKNLIKIVEADFRKKVILCYFCS